jgi:NADPH-dependent 2,4-dienoyl-CoA reductase/sulfur reductase-like enzyme
MQVGDKIVVVGGGAVGFEAALDYANQGKDVTLIEMLDEVRAKMSLRGSAGNGAAELLSIFKQKNILLNRSCIDRRQG